jgi:hypothetical protein
LSHKIPPAASSVTSPSAGHPPRPVPASGPITGPGRPWRRVGWQPYLKRFFLFSPWGWLALSSLLLPLVSGSFSVFKPPALQIVILALSFLLSLGACFFASSSASALAGRTDALVDSVHRRSRPDFAGWFVDLRDGFSTFLIAGGGRLGFPSGGSPRCCPNLVTLTQILLQASC